MKSDSNKSICVLILNYNGYKNTINCIDSLKKSLYKNLRIIVIDNASTDDSIKYIKKSHCDVDIIRTDKNRLFAGGMNYGVKQIKRTGNVPEYVLFLNNDIIINDRRMIRILAEKMEQLGASVAGPLIIESGYPKRSMPSMSIAYTLYNNFMYPIAYVQKILGNIFKSERIMKANAVSGSCFLVKFDDFSEVGGFEEDRGLYYEEYYLADKLRKMNMKTIYVPITSVNHLAGKTISAKFKYKEKVEMLAEGYMIYKNIHGKVSGVIIKSSFYIFYYIYLPIIEQFKTML